MHTYNSEVDPQEISLKPMEIRTYRLQLSWSAVTPAHALESLQPRTRSMIVNINLMLHSKVQYEIYKNSQPALSGYFNITWSFLCVIHCAESWRFFLSWERTCCCTILKCCYSGNGARNDFLFDEEKSFCLIRGLVPCSIYQFKVNI